MDMFFVQQGELTEARRTVPVDLVSGTGYLTPWVGTLTGSPKAKLSLNGGTAADSDNPYTMLDTTNHPGVAQLVLSADEVAAIGDLNLTIQEGNAFGKTFIRIVEWDPLTEGAVSDLTMHQRAGRPA